MRTVTFHSKTQASLFQMSFLRFKLLTPLVPTYCQLDFVRYHVVYIYILYSDLLSRLNYRQKNWDNWTLLHIKVDKAVELKHK